MNRSILTGIIITMFILLSSCRENIKEDYWHGKLKRDKISLSSKVPGRVIEQMVHDGDFVEKGDTLLILHIPEVKAKLLQAKGAYLTAKSNYDMAKTGATGEQLKQIDAKVHAAKEQYVFAESTIQRLEPLYQDSLISPQKYDEALMKYHAADALYKGALAKQEEILSGVREEKIKMALGQLQRAEGALDEVKIAVRERYVIAPKRLEISSVNIREGELALAGYALVSAFDLESIYFRFTVPEHKINTLKQGQRLDVQLLPEQNIVRAEILAIRQLPRYADKTTVWPENQIGETTFEVKAYPTSARQLIQKYNNTTVLLKRRNELDN